MGAPSATVVEMSTNTPTSEPKKGSWKARFGGRRRSPQTPDKAENSTQRTETTTTTTPASLAASRKSARFKKNRKTRLLQLLPLGGSQAKIEEPSSSPSNPQTPLSSAPTDVVENFETEEKPRKQLYEWQDAMEEKRANDIVLQKKEIKERDGFCRRVDAYDGAVITVDGKASYEIGNYLGGGVAGVVYEGNRLLPPDEYPVRSGALDTAIEPPQIVISEPTESSTSFLCADPSSVVGQTPQKRSISQRTMTQRTISTVSLKSSEGIPEPKTIRTDKMAMDFAIETTAASSGLEDAVIVDRPDAPSRSKYAAKAAATTQFFMEETVAVKILNPVGYRVLSNDVLKNAVVIREGEPLSRDVKLGIVPMEERHVWWLVNPNSRNLQTLKRYNQKHKDGTISKNRDIDRGTPEKGLRISLVAACTNKDGQLSELPLTRCIEIWGHVPFGATDADFDEMMEAIERVNAGHTPSSQPPSRVATDNSSLASSSLLSNPVSMINARTGLYRAAATERLTVFSETLNAFIAVPSVPPKYLRWLRQRRSATKEIRNMMLIGRHRNVVHLYEVLEYIEDTKSTMFLILELVRGGELFDLISSNGTGLRGIEDVDSERVMRKFFRELSSGIFYCHANGIAHRDLKPENLLVHTEENDDTTLKIADFGLSATFAVNDDDTVRDSLASPAMSPLRRANKDTDTAYYSTPIAVQSLENERAPIEPEQRSSSLTQSISAIGAQALQYLTCGAMEDVDWCAPSGSVDDEIAASPLRRMTSVVGSPHYVAPEIISQTDKKDKKRRTQGYDGTKADVWSAGVILYAMLFRSLPFGEDLLRCPRYQSFRKWYEEARQVPGGRRASGLGALNPVITESDRDDMLGPQWFFPFETSAESRDLIVAMLNPDPNERLSIQLVLQHPWLLEQPDLDNL